MADTSLVNWQGAVDNQFDYGKNAYLEAAPDLANASAMATGVAGMQAGMAANQGALSKTLADRVDTFSGLQDKYATDAFGMNGAENQNKVSSEAAADVTNKFSGMRAQGMRQMARTGVNPSSGKSLALDNQMSISEAAVKSGAANKARQDLDVVANDHQKTAIGFGANLPIQAAQTANVAGNLSSSALSSAQTPLAQRLQFAGGVSNLYSTAAGGYKGLYQAQNLTPDQQSTLNAKDQASSAAQNAAFIGAIGKYVGSDSGSKAISKGIDYLSGLWS